MRILRTLLFIIVPALLQHQVLKVLQLLLVKLPCCQGAVPQLLPNFTSPKLPNPETVFFLRIRLSSSLHHLMSKGATPKRKLEDLTTSSAAILSWN